MNKKEKEDELLSQLMMDLDLYDAVLQTLRKHNSGRLPAQNELIYGIQKLGKDGNISVWLIFAARLFLEIEDLLGKTVKRGFQDLQSNAREIEAEIKSTDVFPDSDVAKPVCWVTKDSDLPLKLFRTSSIFVTREGFQAMRKLLQEQLGIFTDPNWGKMGDGGTHHLVPQIRQPQNARNAMMSLATFQCFLKIPSWSHMLLKVPK
jgi:hypothetical protein